MKKNKKPKKNNFHPGDLLYYSQFYNFKDRKSNVSNALRLTTNQALKPYHSFLNKAIEVDEKKCNYEINWKKVDSEYRIRLNPIIRKLKIEKTNPYIEIQMTEEIELSFEEEDNCLMFMDEKKFEIFSKNDIIKDKKTLIIFTKYCPNGNEKIKFNSKLVKYKLKDISLDKNSEILNEKGEKIDIKNIYNLNDGWNLELSLSNIPKKLYIFGKELKFSLYDTIDSQNFYEEDNNVFEFEKIGNDYIVKKLPNSETLKNENGEIYKWSEISKEREEFIIQLIDYDNQDGKATSEYFFDDEVVEIYQDKPLNSYSIKRKIFDQKILILKKPKNNRGVKTISLDPEKPIKIVVNTSNLKRQKNAISKLNKCPLENHKNIIRLFENKEKFSWEKPKNININKWYILNENSYDGITKQREFVKKALGTEDFAILEGPPGSGKTTVIIELILQILKEGKKVLLSSSTHVAIDNVLERIKEVDKDNFVEALRIGDLNRIDESVKKYQIDIKIEKYKKNGLDEETAERLTIDSANLVCGTTMGMHRYFNMDIFGGDKNKDRYNIPVDIMFDCMIIDESSKTTFQEFIVPALYAKKWILVGDIKQLSPYIEQSHIVNNLRFLVPSCTQNAIRLIFEALLNNYNPYIIEVDKDVMEEAKEYWNNNSENEFYKNKEILFIDDEYIQEYERIQEYGYMKEMYIELLFFIFLSSDLIFIQKDYWNKCKKYLPKTHILIKKEEIEDYDFLFKQLYLKENNQLPKYCAIDKKKSSENDPIEYAKFFHSMLEKKDWAEEISWRMIRVYERRMLKSPNSYYEKTFNLLKPAYKLENHVDRIYNMTLPSILELLQKGNNEKHRNLTTITEGFDKKDLENRHVILEYQYRMHPEISKFSREQFYTVDNIIALKDSSKNSREWGYDRYKSRNIWIDIPKKEKKTNDRENMNEVKRTIKELKSFIDFAKKNKLPNEKKWTVGIITFYRPQESLFRKELRLYCNKPNTICRFSKDGVDILNYTVDRFQGMEADIVFISMVRGEKIGFLDNINRLNVALTRARFQRVILGDNDFFKTQKNSNELKMLAQGCEVIK